jgi:2-polyprenyl-6-methoxyphenol hydroxylase-like FAD-dependent oxidoreductase
LQNTNKNTEVLIVGAGPSGLMMACQLAIHNVPFRIIDKKERETSYSGALVVHARTLEVFHQMGIAAQAEKEGIEVHQVKVVFNGRKPLRLHIMKMGEGISQFPNLLLLEQSITEHLLRGFISKYGYSVEGNTELIEFGQDASGVTSLVKLPNGKEEVVRSLYLIAADGSQSSIRKQAKIAFKGNTSELSLFVTDCKAAVDMAPGEICFSFSQSASSGLFPLKNGRYRVDGALPDRTDKNYSITFDDVEKDFAARNRMNIRLYDPEWFSVFHSHQQYAESFRQNRCFLVGDAAHVFSPVGAQGMNTGIQDSYNLGWKLAFTIQGKAPASLLASYPDERQPIALNLINATEKVFRLVTSERYFHKMLRLYVSPTIFRLVFYMIERWSSFRRFIFNGIAQVGVQYRKNHHPKLTSNGRFSSEIPRPGDRLPYIRLTLNNISVNIQDKIDGRRYYLFVLGYGSHYEDIITLANKYTISLVTETIVYNPETKPLFDKLGIRNSGLYLVRPDMYIAYRSDKFDPRHFQQYLSQILIK